MKKPQKYKKEILDYHECRDFLQEKTGRDFGDYTNLSKTYIARCKEACGLLGISYADLEEDLTKADIKNPDIARKIKNRGIVSKKVEELEPPYQNFWHYILDAYNLHNGADFTFDESEQPMVDWQREIFMLFIEEFGEGEVGSRTVEMNVWW